MSHPAPVLDHAVVNVRQGLAAAAARYERLGFTLTPPGRHSLGSSNRLCVFAGNYLELLGFDSPQARPELADHPTGLSGLCFRTDDADATHAGLTANGLPAEPPKSFERPVELDGATHPARFRTTRLPAALTPGGRVFFCEHRTPELVWRPEWQSHPNGVTDIAGFVIAARNAPAAAALYRQMFGEAAVRPEGEGFCLNAGSAVVRVLPDDAVRARFGPTAPLAAGSSPRMSALVLRTASLAQAREALARGGVPVRESAPGILVQAPDACDVPLAFVEQDE